MRLATIKKEKITIKFQAKNKAEFDYLLCFVKELPERRFDPTEKVWTCPTSPKTIEKLRSSGFKIVGETEKPKQQESPEIDEEIKPIAPEGLTQTLWKFQEVGVGFIESRNGRALVADSMRLGKTVQALGWTQVKANSKPALIICDASAKLVWADHIRKWLTKKHNIVILQGKREHDIPKDTDFAIVNYESLYANEICYACNGKKKVFNRRCRICKGKGKIPMLRSDLRGFKFNTLIVDEAQKMRDDKTYHTQIILQIGKTVPYVIATTGTPIENRPDEFFNIISLINPKLFPKRWDFRKQFCGLHHDGFGWNYKGSTNTKELHTILKNTIMIRRLFHEVEKDTPEKVRPVIPLEFDERCKEEYRITSKKITSEGAKSKYGNKLAQYEILKQIAVQGKMESAIKWIEEFLEEGGKKLVVFCIHQKVIDILHNHFKNVSVVLDGRTSSTIDKEGLNDRKRAEIAFQTNDKITLFIGNIQAASKAICLDAANDVAFMEFSFVPGHHAQAEDRPLSLKKKGMHIYSWYLVAKGTIEEDIVELLDKKCKILNQVLDGQDADDTSMFSELLEKLKEREGLN